MSDFGAWLDSTGYGGNTAALMAARTLQYINENPDSVQFVREGTGTLAAQNVRVMYMNTASSDAVVAAGGSIGTQGVVVFGIKDHATAADTDIERGDKFLYDGARHVVKTVNNYPGQIQAICERLS